MVLAVASVDLLRVAEFMRRAVGLDGFCGGSKGKVWVCFLFCEAWKSAWAGRYFWERAEVQA